MKLSIIIPVLNNFKYTKACIESIAKYSKTEHEIIVVDNGSTDETVEWCTKNGCHVLVNVENKGYSYLMNTGANLSTGEYICFLNNDTYLSDSWDIRLINHLEESGTSIASSSCIENARFLPYEIHKCTTSLIDMSKSSYERFIEEVVKKASNTSVTCISGSLVLIRASQFGRGLMWDENLTWGGNDFDMFMQGVNLKGFGPPKLFHDTFHVHFSSKTLKANAGIQSSTPYLSKKWNIGQSQVDFNLMFSRYR